MFFLIKHFLYWSLVDLHCCVNFCSIAKWFSYIYTCVCVCVCVYADTSFFMSFCIIVYLRILNMVLCIELWDLVHPSCIWQFVSIPKLPPPTLATKFSLFHRCVHFCHISESTYKSYHVEFVFLFVRCSLSVIISSCIHVAANGVIFFFFYGWVTFRCIHVPHLLCAFICWCTFSFSPCLGYCEQCCCDHRVGVCIF